MYFLTNMAFPKKRAYNQFNMGFKDNERKDVITIEDETLDKSTSDYMSPGSPVTTIDTIFENNIHHKSCPVKTKKPTNVNLYTRYTSTGFQEPINYLIWYNVVISTGYRNYQPVCCASIKIDVSKIIGSTDFKTCSSLQPVCCETTHTNSIETTEKAGNSLYLDTITTKTDSIPTASALLTSTFTRFYDILLSLFEELYPACIIFGLNNLIIKNTIIDIDKIFELFLEKIRKEYSFYYKQTNSVCFEENKHIQEIQSWLTSPLTDQLEDFTNMDVQNLDFFSLLE